MMRRLIIYCLLALGLYGVAQAETELRLRVRKVTFAGNETFDKLILHKVMVSHPSKFLIPVIYNPDVLSNDLDALANYYRRRGFLKAAIKDHQVVIDSVKKKVDIHVEVIEGPRTLIEGITFIGNFSISDSTLSETGKIKPNQPLDADDIEKAQLALLRAYANLGFLDAEVEPVWTLDSEALQASLDFNVREGIQYSVGQIEIRGLEKTRPKIVLRELEFESGEIINYSKILKSQRSLYLTGLFESVYIDPEFIAGVTDSAHQDLYIRTKENQAGSFSISFGYGSVDRWRTKAEFIQNNVMGSANKFGITARASYIQRSLEMSHSNPRVFDSRWRSDLNLKYDLQFQPVYRLKSYGGILAVQRNLDRYLSTTLSFKNEINQLSDVKLDTITAGVNAANVHSINLRFTRDSRDNLFNPQKGVLLEWENEVAGGPVTSSNTFYRSVLKLRWFKPLFTESVLGTALEVGLVTTPSGTHTVSLQERFYSGGPNSLRGYAYREVGPHDANGFALGGFYKLVWNVYELRVPVYKGLQISTFADVGNVWWTFRDILQGQWAADAGIGLLYNTPIGVVRMDAGVPMGNIPVKDRIRFNFSMGYAF